jgi:hypothetical protein
MFFWSPQCGVKLHFIQPRKPTQNALVESFNDRFRGAESAAVRRPLPLRGGSFGLARSLQHGSTTHSLFGYMPPALFEAAA